MAQVTVETDTDAFLAELKAYADGLGEESRPHEQDFQRLVLNSMFVAVCEFVFEDFVNELAAEFGISGGTLRRYARGLSHPIAGIRYAIITECAEVLPRLVAEGRKKYLAGIAAMRNIGG